MGDRVLVVEDDTLVRSLVELNLVDAGYDVTAVGTFTEGAARLDAGGWALVVLDLMLPDGDGFELVARTRRRGDAVPILMLTARGEASAKVRALDAGADDYLAKPFGLAELLARARALLRRGRPPAARTAPAAELVLGPYRVRLDTGGATSRRGALVLTDTQLRALTLFARMDGQIVTRADLLEEAWGGSGSGAEVDACVGQLRELFEPDPEVPVHFIHHPGRGYVFRRAGPGGPR